MAWQPVEPTGHAESSAFACMHFYVLPGMLTHSLRLARNSPRDLLGVVTRPRTSADRRIFARLDDLRFAAAVRTDHPVTCSPSGSITVADETRGRTAGYRSARGESAPG